MTNTILNVSRELLADLLGNDHDKRIMAERHLLAMLANAPSPAGVDGLEVVSNWVLFNAEADKPYIKKMLPEGFLAFFDCEEDARRAKANNPGTDYKRIDRVKAEDAKAIIDGLRGEVAALRKRAKTAEREAGSALATYKGLEKVARVVSDNSDQVCGELNVLRQQFDQQAQRIGGLEGLLRDVAGMFRGPGIEGGLLTKLRRRIDAALSGIKEDL